MPHVHTGALHALITTLEVIVTIFVLNALAMKFPNNPIAASWLALSTATR